MLGRTFPSQCLSNDIKLIQLPSDMLVVPTEKGLLRIMDDFMGSGTASIMVQNQQLRANASPADLLKV